MIYGLRFTHDVIAPEDGVNDGLVSNASLILGIAGASVLAAAEAGADAAVRGDQIGRHQHVVDGDLKQEGSDVPGRRRRWPSRGSWGST